MQPQRMCERRLGVHLHTTACRVAIGLLLAMAAAAWADNYTDPPAPTLSISNTPGQKRISITPYPSADQIHMLRANVLGGLWNEDSSGMFSNLTWTAAVDGSNAFHRAQVIPLSSNPLLT